MTRGRIEAFTDGVVAIIITIMVLELKVPHGHDLSALAALLPVLLSYVLSFANVGIYWNNHHHMFHSVKHVGGWVLWANLHLLFWLSLMPFATAYMAESGFERLPVALYCFDLLMCVDRLLGAGAGVAGRTRARLGIRASARQRHQGQAVDAGLSGRHGVGALQFLGRRADRHRGGADLDRPRPSLRPRGLIRRIAAGTADW